MTARPWFRFYRASLNSPKIQKLPPELFKAWVNILCATDDDGELPSLDSLAFLLRSDADTVARWLDALRGAQLLDSDGETDLAHDWHDHQYASDGDPTAAERKRRQREKEKSQSGPPDNVTRDMPVAVTRTEQIQTRTETEKNMSWPSAPDGFEEFWKAYPRTPNMSKSAALKAWRKVKATLPPKDQLLVLVAKYRAFLAAETKKNGRDYPAKHAQGWLNERRWEGFISAEQTATSQATHAADWADSIEAWERFKHTIHPTIWANLFAICKPNGSPSTLIAPSSFVRDQIESRYGKTLDTIFNGEFQVKTENHP